MDPITAFSLAGTIATFIDFGAKFAKLTWSIYHDESSSTPASELSKLTAQFEQAATAVEIPSNHQPNASEDNLNQLAKECKEFSAKIVKLLRKAGLLNQQPNSKKAAFISAIRLTFRRGDLDNLKKELEGLRDRFSFLLLISLRSLAQRNLAAQDEVIQALKLSGKKNHDFRNSMQLIMSDLASKIRAVEGSSSQAGLENDIVRQVLQDGSSAQASGAYGIVLSNDIREHLGTVLTKSLIYFGMNDRQEQVLPSFETTFDWALNDIPDPNQKWANLPLWLVSDNQIYWISGKAGSGKSTFMKYLLMCPGDRSKPRCHLLLSRWAKNRELIIVSFFFWAADSEKLQKSREGLFRTLLHQILTMKPTLIPQIFPKQWEILSMTRLKILSWSESDLRAGFFRAIASLQAQNCCICLFIDGLDEFEGQPSILIELVRVLASQGDCIKLCLASRPWVEFGDAFRQKPQLLLEDLTYNDIKFFVTRKFDDHPEFNNLKICEPDFADQLVENIVSKGQGVFLWIALVVASLLSGISFGDRVEDLQRRLDLLPPDLEDLYGRLIDGLDPFYHKHRAQLMMLVESAQEALPVLVLYFADGGTIGILKTLPGARVTEDSWIQQVDTMRRRLNSRWRGLLELSSGKRPGFTYESSSDPSPRVRYLHKTVSDFVKGAKMRAFIQQHTGADFDPHLQLCIGYCAYALSDSASPSHKDKWDFVDPCLKHAREVNRHNEEHMRHTIDQLHMNLHPEHVRGLIRHDLLRFGIREDVAAYVLPILENIPHDSGEITTLLNEALTGCIINADIVRALLARVSYGSKMWSNFMASVTHPKVFDKIRKSGNSDAEELYEELKSSFEAHNTKFGIFAEQYSSSGPSTEEPDGEKLDGEEPDEELQSMKTRRKRSSSNPFRPAKKLSPMPKESRSSRNNHARFPVSLTDHTTTP